MIIAASLTVAPMALLSAQPSMAAVPAACPYEIAYTTTSRVTGYAPTSATSYQVAGPATISRSESEAAAHQFGVNVSFTVSASAIIAKAEATFGADYSYTSTKTQEWTYSTTIPSGKTGRMVVLHRADKAAFGKKTFNTNCTTLSQSGTAYVPRASQGNLDYCVIRDLTPYLTTWTSTCASQ